MVSIVFRMDYFISSWFMNTHKNAYVPLYNSNCRLRPLLAIITETISIRISTIKFWKLVLKTFFEYCVLEIQLLDFTVF